MSNEDRFFAAAFSMLAIWSWFLFKHGRWKMQKV